MPDFLKQLADREDSVTDDITSLVRITSGILTELKKMNELKKQELEIIGEQWEE